MIAAHTRLRRLERAGFVPIVVQGRTCYVSRDFLICIDNQVELWRREVEAILAEPARPRGWQRGVPHPSKGKPRALRDAAAAIRRSAPP